MRIACYGLAEEHAGSVASANYILLQKLLDRGVRIDFFAKSDFVKPGFLFTDDQFYYDGTLLHHWVELQERTPLLQNGVLGRLADECIYRAHLRAIGNKVRRWHRLKPYDALLFLGLEPQFRAPPDVPVVAWVQGPPQTEWQAIARVRDVVEETSGRLLFEQLRLFYAMKRLAVRRSLRQAETIICGSQWSCEKIVDEGFAPERVRALPYPVDLSVFSPMRDPQPLHPGRKTLLWLGRIDPRKRLDLLLSGFATLLQRRRDVHLHIVGWFSYAPGLRKLLDVFPYPDHVTYEERRPREDMPGLLSQADVLVQPSEDENFGSAVAEALACGTPAVLGPTNGTGEYCGVSAFRMAGYTPTALADALSAALQAVEEEPEAISASAVAQAEAVFAPARVADQLLALLQEVTPSNGLPASVASPASAHL